MKVFTYCKTTSPVSRILRDQAGIVGWGEVAKEFWRKTCYLNSNFKLNIQCMDTIQASWCRFLTKFCQEKRTYTVIRRMAPTAA